MQYKTMKVCNIAIVLSSISVGASTQPNAQCLNNQPIWSNCSDSGSNFCGDNLWWSLRCDKLNQVWIQPCYCMYYDKKYKTAIAGQCMHACFYLHPSLETGSFHFPIQRYPVENYSLFNQDMCNVLPDLNRMESAKKSIGFQITPTTFLTAYLAKKYSYKNWIKLLIAILLPLTIFYIAIACFKISITSSHLNGLVFVLHCSSSPIQQRVITNILRGSLIEKTVTTRSVTAINVGLSLMSTFNLDFFVIFSLKSVSTLISTCSMFCLWNLS